MLDLVASKNSQSRTGLRVGSQFSGGLRGDRLDQGVSDLGGKMVTSRRQN